MFPDISLGPREAALSHNPSTEHFLAPIVTSSFKRSRWVGRTGRPKDQGYTSRCESIPSRCAGLRPCRTPRTRSSRHSGVFLRCLGRTWTWYTWAPKCEQEVSMSELRWLNIRVARTELSLKREDGLDGGPWIDTNIQTQACTCTHTNTPHSRTHIHTQTWLWKEEHLSAEVLQDLSRF